VVRGRRPRGRGRGLLWVAAAAFAGAAGLLGSAAWLVLR
jgi:hypothetical protein